MLEYGEDQLLLDVGEFRTLLQQLQLLCSHVQVSKETLYVPEKVGCMLDAFDKLQMTQPV